jgi:hypothetical protein
VNANELIVRQPVLEVFEALQRNKRLLAVNQMYPGIILQPFQVQDVAVEDLLDLVRSFNEQEIIFLQQ